ncbi:MAG: hypothetical protein Q7K65_04175 [Candidatus Buchananbacteria bacterium]|nr:hypothetical protein [Candidatus Buchananbacteria bacterium]
MKPLTIKQILLLIISLAAVFILVYSPHFNYHLPYHIDEWRHVSEALKITHGLHNQSLIVTEFGFHLILASLAKILPLVDIYQFLPAIWATITAFVLFWVAYRKTSCNFYIAILSVLFFASLKSNVNILGLWFFTPLTFSIPFIFLYFYFFTEGIEKQKSKYIIFSFFIIVFILLIHSISITFVIPVLVLYCLINFRKTLKVWKSLLIFISLPVIGVAILLYMIWPNIPDLFNFKGYLTVIKFVTVFILNFGFKFKSGWGVLEYRNSPLEVYSLVGYGLALLGGIFIFSRRDMLKKYSPYLLWPAWLIVSILFYYQLGVSYFSPYQRNLYYLAIGLPLLSAIGLYCLALELKNYISTVWLQKIAIASLLAVVFFLSFQQYYRTPYQFSLYQVVDTDSYPVLEFLARLSPTQVAAAPLLSSAIYPLTGHEPFYSLVFGPMANKADAEKLFSRQLCTVKNDIIKKYKIKYYLTEQTQNCGWKEIYRNQKYIIYQTNE